jgi:hypothetical protein
VSEAEARSGAPPPARRFRVPAASPGLRAKLKAQAPKMYHEIFDDPPPGEALVAPRMQPQIVRYLAARSSAASAEKIRETFNFEKYFSNPRRW